MTKPRALTISVPTLLPAESMALTVARAQLERGENPPPNTTAMLVMALDRLTGREDWSEDAGSH